jgi:hypothetical protein
MQPSTAPQKKNRKSTLPIMTAITEALKGRDQQKNSVNK